MSMHKVPAALALTTVSNSISRTNVETSHLISLVAWSGVRCYIKK